MNAFGWTILIVIGIMIALAVYSSIHDANTMRNGTPEEIAALLAMRETLAHGELKPLVICPHCQVTGNVRTKSIKNKKGISGGKATGALLTGGVSMLATGLSRKEAAIAAHCSNCRMDWEV